MRHKKYEKLLILRFSVDFSVIFRKFMTIHVSLDQDCRAFYVLKYLNVFRVSELKLKMLFRRLFSVSENLTHILNHADYDQTTMITKSEVKVFDSNWQTCVSVVSYLYSTSKLEHLMFELILKTKFWLVNQRKIT